ncbi:Protein kinase domain-containing protein [Mycena kentingensis (nom. inval.)]|nr:Protein kinase domain-containing protein [Mycena kentingensis (nom. inval.)]
MPTRAKLAMPGDRLVALTRSSPTMTVPLPEREMYWFDLREFLQDAGYRLRPKFHADHVPDTSTVQGSRDFYCTHMKRSLMDARRMSDNTRVMLKVVSISTHPYEVDIARLFSSASSPRNHCIDIIEVLHDPKDADKKILVMPHLKPFHKPKFDTVGEVVDCFRQIFEGVEFMHENYVAHRDLSLMNVVLDPTKLFPYGFHPVHHHQDLQDIHPARHITRTDCWPHYFIIDFGLSRQYNPAEGPPDEQVIYGGDKSPPEHRDYTSCNPFPTDIYFLGNLLKERLLYRQPSQLEQVRDASFVNPKMLNRSKGPPCTSLLFLEPLIAAMTLPDPSQRPTIGEAIVQFDELCSKLSEWHLRRQGQKHAFPFTWIRFFRQLKRAVMRVPPVPPYTPRTDRPTLTPEMRAFYTQTRPRKAEKSSAAG